MGTRARKLNKSVHSEGQTAFRGLMTSARKAAGLTQQELATKLGKAHSMAEIAARENITDNYVSNLIHLAWVIPASGRPDLGRRSGSHQASEKIRCLLATLISFGESRLRAHGRR